LRRALGLPKLPGAFFDWPAQVAERYLHATTPEFEYPRRDLPENVELVGALFPDGVDAWRPPAWWREVVAPERRRPAVLVTQGTVTTDASKLLLPAVEALAGDDVIVLATTGGADPDDVLPPGRRPANLRLETFVPFTELLPYVDAMVKNAGYGGVQTELAH